MWQLGLVMACNGLGLENLAWCYLKTGILEEHKKWGPFYQTSFLFSFLLFLVFWNHGEHNNWSSKQEPNSPFLSGKNYVISLHFNFLKN